MFSLRWVNVPSMACPALLALLAAIRSLLWSRAQLQAEVLALRHQLLVLKRQCAGRRVHFQTSDRVLWSWLSRLWPDRDGIYGTEFQRRVEGMGLVEVPIAPRSPWQNAYAERFVGSSRRECLDHVIALNERQVYRIVSSYARYYNRARTHLALAKDAPEPRNVQSRAHGRVVAFPEVGGLHHRYERLAA